MIAVMLQLVRPAGATRRLRYDYRTARMNESGRRIMRVLAGWVSLMIGYLDPIRTSRQWLANRTLKRTLDHIRRNGHDPDKPHLLTAHGTAGPADKQRY